MSIPRWIAQARGFKVATWVRKRAAPASHRRPLLLPVRPKLTPGAEFEWSALARHIAAWRHGAGNRSAYTAPSRGAEDQNSSQAFAAVEAPAPGRANVTTRA